MLGNRTGPQRLLLELGALATAVLAIGALVMAVITVVGRLGDDDDDDGGTGRSGVARAAERIEPRTTEADEFVGWLLDHEDSVVQLDHEVVGELTAADARLLYACSAGGVCASTRIQDADVVGTETDDGWWFQGCFAVARDGRGYGVEPLDIELSAQGDQCPEG
jgi:hypothetical protein